MFVITHPLIWTYLSHRNAWSFSTLCSFCELVTGSGLTNYKRWVLIQSRDTDTSHRRASCKLSTVHAVNSVYVNALHFNPTNQRSSHEPDSRVITKVVVLRWKIVPTASTDKILSAGVNGAHTVTWALSKPFSTIWRRAWDNDEIKVRLAINWRMFPNCFKWLSWDLVFVQRSKFKVHWSIFGDWSLNVVYWHFLSFQHELYRLTVSMIGNMTTQFSFPGIKFNFCNSSSSMRTLL